ncbi:hypothetical protein [Aquimarina megaterium]|uniref:hypothetical protein n=1 Tax=Aquimarina megaterium TaxID=1443666 RepID=UPI00046EDE25|nr:hypothetical protein [Aquimarina megaterium]
MSIFNSIWKGIETSFDVITGNEDILYPDNKNRKKRASELFNDVKHFQQEIVLLKKNIEQKLNSIGLKYKDSFNLERFNFKLWEVESVDKLRRVLELSNIQDALMISGLLSLSDENEQKRVIDTIDLPFDMKMITIKGIPILFYGGVIGGSIAGATARSKLREYIKHIQPVRNVMFYYKMLLEELSKNLSKLGSKEFLISIYNKDLVEEKFEQKIGEIKEGLLKITKNDALVKLKNRDKLRGSWLNED